MCVFKYCNFFCRRKYRILKNIPFFMICFTLLYTWSRLKFEKFGFNQDFLASYIDYFYFSCELSPPHRITYKRNTILMEKRDKKTSWNWFIPTFFVKYRKESISRFFCLQLFFFLFNNHYYLIQNYPLVLDMLWTYLVLFFPDLAKFFQILIFSNFFYLLLLLFRYKPDPWCIFLGKKV